MIHKSHFKQHFCNLEPKLNFAHTKVQTIEYKIGPNSHIKAKVVAELKKNNFHILC